MMASRRRPFKVFYLLGITLVLLLWLEQRSINAYWVQTYHQTSPLSSLENHSVWLVGEKVAEFLSNELTPIQEQLAEYNEQLVTNFNSNLVTVDDNSSTIINKEPVELKLVVDFKEIVKPKPLIFPQLPSIRLVAVAEDNEAVLADDHFLLVNKSLVAQPELVGGEQQDKRLLIEKGQKVFFVGDSLMQGVAPYAMRALLKEHGIESINLSKQSTGLAYPRFYNWPQIARDTFAKEPTIKLMVVFMGPNDPWDFPVIKGGRFLKFTSPEWEGVYRARIQQLINAATSHGAKVLWIGAPNMRDPKLNAGVIKLNRIYQSQVTIAKQYYIPSNDVLGMRDSNFVKFINIPNRGNVTLRTDDGIHFTPIGQKRIADKIISLLRFNQPTETTEQ